MLARVVAGEVVITLDGRPVATLVPIDRRTPSWSKAELLREVLVQPADRGLYDELREMLPDATDDLP